MQKCEVCCIVCKATFLTLTGQLTEVKMFFFSSFFLLDTCLCSVFQLTIWTVGLFSGLYAFPSPPSSTSDIKNSISKFQQHISVTRHHRLRLRLPLPLLRLLGHSRDETVNHLHSVAALGFYQKMAHLFWKLKLDSRRRDLRWRRFLFHILTVLVEIEPLKRGFAGTSASMCSVQGTVIQGLQSCSEWLYLRGGTWISFL